MEATLRTRLAGRLSEKIAIVTGAGDGGEADVGIGFGIASILAAAGASVVVFDRDELAATRAAGLISGDGLVAAPFVGDVTSAADCDSAANFAVSRFGRLDILVNNAAIQGRSPRLEDSDDGILATLDTNLIGPIRMARACRPYMVSGAAIVNISSLGALRAWEHLDYAASKGGLLSMTMDLAVQLGPAGIRVNAICPGQVWTPMGKRRLLELGHHEDEIPALRRNRVKAGPLGIEGTAWDIGMAALFLGGEEARWVTGQTLIVDGGQSCLPYGVPG